MIEGLTDPDRGFNRSWKSHHWFYWKGNSQENF